MRTALYLEDDVALQDVMSMFLEIELPSDFSVLKFRSLQAFKVAASSKTADLVVSDLNVLDAGPQEIADVLSLLSLKGAPVVITSGDFDAIRTLEKRQPSFEFLPKGEDLSKLGVILKKLGIR